MSALARYFSFHGKRVSGYDRSETTLTKDLEKEGIDVIFSEDAALAPKDVQLVVYTPAIPASHAQLKYYRDNGFQVVKRSEVLGAITESTFNICIAGTHGKTTISTMVAHILRHTGYGCNAFLGGIAVNYNNNFWSSERNVCVVEADEYDRSFLTLSPDIAVISAMDADHLDIYGTAGAMEEAFVQFANQVKPGGILITKKGLPREEEMRTPKRYKYSLTHADADIYGMNIRLVDGHYVFDLKINEDSLLDVELNMGGLHNVENASVAIAIARGLDIDKEAVKLAVKEFKGVKRRFEYVVRTGNVVYVDDYAHHPEELAALIGSARKLFPDHHCLVIFQPHLFSRTRDLADGFAKSLDEADEVVVLPIYPARELPVEGVTAETITGKMKKRNVRVIPKDGIASYVRERLEKEKNKLLLITAGAGDIDTLVKPIAHLLNGPKDGH